MNLNGLRIVVIELIIHPDAALTAGNEVAIDVYRLRNLRNLSSQFVQQLAGLAFIKVRKFFDQLIDRR